MQTAVLTLTDPQQEILTLKIQQIVHTVKPEKIICFGMRVNTLGSWGCFSGDEQITVLYCNLLIIIKETDKRKTSEVLDAVDKCSDPTIKISPIVHGIQSINESLLKGGRFFSELYFSGILLYDTQKTVLNQPPASPAKEVVLLRIESIWNKWFGLAVKFFNSAIHSLQAGWPDLAMFQLHQATEHTCNAIIRVYTGYRSSTHNLKRLLMLTENFSLSTMDVFPCHTTGEIELLNLLTKAYSDVRYNINYRVSPEQVAILIDRIQTLQETSNYLYRQKLASLKS
jgi:HEPN domain-containing protein